MKNKMASFLAFFLLTISTISHAELIMYVPTGETNELLIIDLVTDKITGRIDELENAHGLSGNSNTEYLIAGSMQPLDAKNSGAVKPAQISEAEHAAHHAGGKSTAKKTAISSYLSIIHPKHGHVMRRVEVSGLTHHTAVSPDGKIAIAVHSGTGGISVVDLEKMDVLKTIKTGMWPNYAVFTNDGRFVYVSNAGTGVVSEIDTAKWRLTREIKVGKEPEHMAMAADNKTLYVANKSSGSVSVINLQDAVVTQTFSIGKKVHGIDLSDDGRWLFVVSKGEDVLSKVNLASGEIIRATLSPAPYHLAYIPGLDKLYVSSRKLPKIWVLDPKTLAIKKEINLGKGVAHQMVVRSSK